MTMSEEIGSDLRMAARSARRAGGFTLTALLTIALGVGTTTAVFSIVDATLLRDLPAVMLEAPAALFLRQGRSVAGVGGASAEGQKIRLYDEKKNFLGLGEITAEGDIAPKKIVGNVQKL